PLLYREFAREYPDRVAAIAIRPLTAGEQVLAHGTLTPSEEPGRDRQDTPAPEVSGADGYEPAPLLRRAMRTRDRPAPAHPPQQSPAARAPRPPHASHPARDPPRHAGRGGHGSPRLTSRRSRWWRYP